MILHRQPPHKSFPERLGRSDAEPAPNAHLSALEHPAAHVADVHGRIGVAAVDPLRVIDGGKTEDNTVRHGKTSTADFTIYQSNVPDVAEPDPAIPLPRIVASESLTPAGETAQELYSDAVNLLKPRYFCLNTTYLTVELPIYSTGHSNHAPETSCAQDAIVSHPAVGHQGHVSRPDQSAGGTQHVSGPPHAPGRAGAEFRPAVGQRQSPQTLTCDECSGRGRITIGRPNDPSAELFVCEVCDGTGYAEGLV